jgi:hypothetical protein
VVILDLADHLKDARTLRLLKDVVHQFERTGATLILLDCRDHLPDSVRHMACTFELELPDEARLEQLAKSTLREANERRRISVDVDRTTFTTIVRNLQGLSLRQARRVIMECVMDDRRLDFTDVPRILAAKRRELQGGGLLEFVDAPASLDEIGGLKRLKDWLGKRQDALSAKASQFGIPAPRGVLMLGVQGAGKSLSAKAVATAWGRPLLRMDVGALYDRYVGESERRLRDTLKQAEMMAPIILWIDEIEKAFASAASQSTDGGLSKRMFGTLLTWMQEHTAPVFLIATANDIEALPPELLRKGRFDEIFFVDLPTIDARHAILSIHLKKRGREPTQFDLDTLAEASAGFSGAEIEQAIITALCDAFAARQELSNGHVLEALKSSPPLSVTMAERIASLRSWAASRCVPAD